MKKTTKILVFLCMFVILLCPLSVFAEDTVDVPTSEETTTTTPEVVPETPTETTTETETPAEDKSKDFDWGEVKDTVSGFIVSWVQPHLEEISVVIAMLGFIVDNRREKKKMKKVTTTLNNNAIAIADECSKAMENALSTINAASEKVLNYEERIAELLASAKNNAEDRKKLETEIVELKEYLAVSTKANIEFANELAELLALANIPNYKKEEIGARHMQHLNAILEAEAHAEHVADALVVVEEVKENDGETA
jgi:hypothetical protein